MTDRTERGGGPRGRKPGPRRPGQGGRPPRPEAPRTERREDSRRREGPRSGDGERPRSPRVPRGEGRGEERRPATRPDGSPHSKRFGRRPPKEGRAPSSTSTGRERPERGDRPVERGGSRKPWGRPAAGGRSSRPFRDRSKEGGERPSRSRGPERPWKKTGDDGPRRPFRSRTPERKTEDDGRIRLNRYLSNAGVASRREADELIKAGVVTVNGKVVTELGTKVGPNDKVHYGGQRLSREQKRYVLLNKPKDFITTTDDPRDRRTVMALVEKACSERIYPVGRLDRNTTGLLLLTNDGDLAKKLTHPSHGAEKIYHVTLDKNVAKADLDQLIEGVPLEDGPARADEARYVDDASKREVGLKLHMGRNRVVRRMFEVLGYEVVKLDRVVFAGLTKKDLPRGHWRHLSEKEVLFLTKRK